MGNLTTVILDREQVELLMRTRDLLEELIETLDIVADQTLMDAIKEGEKDAEASQTREYDEFIEELRDSSEI